MSRKPRWQQEDPRFRDESKRYAQPIPSREHLLAKLSEAKKPLGFDALATELGIREAARTRGAVEAARRDGARRAAPRQSRK